MSFMFQHSSGSVECRLCLTVHPSQAAFLSHAEGRQHTEALAKLEAKKPESRQSSVKPQKRKIRKIGIPMYDIIKIRDPKTQQLGLRLELKVPELVDGIEPQFRLMSAYEQTVDEVNTNYQYLVVAAEPYENVALRIPARPIDDSRTLSHYSSGQHTYQVQLLFQEEE